MSAERTLTANIITMIQQDLVKPVLFIFADFPSGAQRLWTGIGDKIWNSNTYSGIGEAISFDTFAETADTTAHGISAKINSLDATILSDVIDDDYQGQDCTIWVSFWNAAEDILYDMPRAFWQGTLDDDRIIDDGTIATLTIKAEHRVADILRTREYLYTDEDQEVLHPGAGDTGLNKIEQIQDINVIWGRRRARSQPKFN